MVIILRILLEGVLGYLLQAGSFVIGMHAIAKQKLDVGKAAIVCVISALITYFIRNSGLFNFGVHTMLVLLVLNACCIIICQMNIRSSILGSIVMMLLVLLSELVNVGILSLFFKPVEITAKLKDPIIKAASAVPGNLLLLLISIMLYRIRSCKRKGAIKDDSGQSDCTEPVR